MDTNLYRIQEGMEVLGTQGEKLGKVGKVVVGESTRQARFFTIEKGLIFTKDYLVPREVIRTVDANGKAHVSLSKDQIQRLPEWDGDAPTAEEVRKAYEVAGGRRSESYMFNNLPGVVGDERGAQGGTRSPYYAPAEERYSILPTEERQRSGYRTEWRYD